MSGVLLTKRDTWLTRDMYTQLVYIACSAWSVSSSCHMHAAGADACHAHAARVHRVQRVEREWRRCFT